MTEHVIKVIVGLSDEDRALLKAAASGKGAPAGKPKPKQAIADAGDDDFGDTGDSDDTGGDTSDDTSDDFEGGDNDEPELSQADVATALRALAAVKGQSNASAIKVMKAAGGTDKLSTLKPAKFAEVIAAVEKATVAAKKIAKTK